jgi:hypothetical protein
MTSNEAMAAAAAAVAAAVELQLRRYDAADTHPLQRRQFRLYYLEAGEEIRDLTQSLDERGVLEKAVKEAAAGGQGALLLLLMMTRQRRRYLLYTSPALTATTLSLLSPGVLQWLTWALLHCVQSCCCARACYAG